MRRHRASRMIGIVLFSLSVLSAVPGAATTTILDAVNDAATEDILFTSAGFTPSTFFFLATFRPGTLDPANLAFVLALDTDLNSGTGVQPPLPYPGADFLVVLETPVNLGNPQADVFDATGTPQGVVDVFFVPNAFAMGIPLSLLGNSTGAARFGLLVGPDPSTLTDVSTMVGLPAAGESVGPLDGPPATAIPEPAAIVLLASALAAGAVAARRRAA